MASGPPYKEKAGATIYWFEPRENLFDCNIAPSIALQTYGDLIIEVTNIGREEMVSLQAF